MFQLFVGTCLFAEITSSVLWMRRSPLAPFKITAWGLELVLGCQMVCIVCVLLTHTQLSVVVLEMSNVRQPLLCSVLMPRVYVVVRCSVK